MSRDYLRALELYRQRTWTCAATGRSGLSYEEALTSECLSGGPSQPVHRPPPPQHPPQTPPQQLPIALVCMQERFSQTQLLKLLACLSRAAARGARACGVPDGASRHIAAAGAAVGHRRGAAGQLPAWRAGAGLARRTRAALPCRQGAAT